MMVHRRCLTLALLVVAVGPAARCGQRHGRLPLAPTGVYISPLIPAPTAPRPISPAGRARRGLHRCPTPRRSPGPAGPTRPLPDLPANCRTRSAMAATTPGLRPDPALVAPDRHGFDEGEVGEPGDDPGCDVPEGMLWRRICPEARGQRHPQVGHMSP